MRSLKLHLSAFAALLPCVMAVSEGNLLVNLFGLLYAVWLIIWLNESERGKRFLRRYHAEICRIEQMLNQ